MNIVYVAMPNGPRAQIPAPGNPGRDLAIAEMVVAWFRDGADGSQWVSVYGAAEGGAAVDTWLLADLCGGIRWVNGVPTVGAQLAPKEAPCT